MTMLTDVSVVRPLVLLLFLLGQIHEVHAGPDPTPTDWIPRFSEVLIEGTNVLLKAEDSQIRLFNAQFGNHSTSPIDNLKEKTRHHEQIKAACSVPDTVLSRYRNEYNSPVVWLCDLPDRIWFATGGYCGEGDDQPALNMGRLYSYSPGNGAVIQYPGALPRCSELAGLERAGNTLLAITLYQDEYSQSPGEVLVLDLEHIKSPPKLIRNPNPTGAVTAVSRYDKKCNCIWLVTGEGVERLTLDAWKWEQRYFDFEVTPDNRFALTLSSTRPSDEKMWLGRVLYNFPIEDLRGFITAWHQSAVLKNSDSRLRASLSLLPFYIAAIERTKDWEKDWTYGELMRLVAMHQDADSKPAARAYIEQVLRQPTKPSRKGEVISAAKRLGVDSRSLEAAHFNGLLIEYFSGSKTKYSYEKDVVRYAFEHPEYLPRLRDYYQTNIIAFDIEKSFLDTAKSYQMWQGYSVMAATIDEGLERMKHRSDLFRMCALNETPRDENKLLSILQARLETDAQAKLTNGAGWGEHNCIDASFYWINYGGLDQVHRRIDLMLATADAHREYGPLILEALNRRYSTSFKKIDEWKLWWNSTSPTTNSLR